MNPRWMQALLAPLLAFLSLVASAQEGTSAPYTVVESGRSFARLQDSNPGIDPSGVVAAGVTLPGAKYQDENVRRIFYRRVVDRLESTPGVQAAGAVTPLPLSMDGWQTSTADARSLDQLPAAARQYLDRIEALVETPISYVSVGTRRDQIISARKGSL